LRQEGYREAVLDTILNSWRKRPARGLEADLFDVVAGKKSFESIDDLWDDLSQDNSKAVETIRREYGITAQEEEDILKSLEDKI
jgi:hypothetical protein